jgi:hypothetical protein
VIVVKRVDFVQIHEKALIKGITPLLQVPPKRINGHMKRNLTPRLNLVSPSHLDIQEAQPVVRWLIEDPVAGIWNLNHVVAASSTVDLSALDAIRREEFHLLLEFLIVFREVNL